jgi:phosphinothricin acetyltransferase
LHASDSRVLFVIIRILFFPKPTKAKTMIARARNEHLSAIDHIYNQAIADGQRTAHMNPLSKQQRLQWFEIHAQENYPIFVWLEDNEVLGWLSISPYRADRQALDEVAEVSYYVDYSHHGKDIATRLMDHAIGFCRDKGFRILVAIMVSGNEASAGLTKKFGFTECGRIGKALRYGEDYKDHVYMSLDLG